MRFSDESSSEAPKVSSSVLDFIRPYLGRIFVIGLLGIGLAACTGIYGFMAGPVLKLALTSRTVMLPFLPGLRTGIQLDPEEFFWLYVAVIMGAAALKGLLSYGFAVSRTSFGHLISRRLRTTLFQRLEGAKADDVERLGKGQLIARFLHDIDHVERLFSEGVVKAFHSLVEVLILLALCLFLDAYLALLFFGLYPVILLPILTLTRRLRTASKRSQQAVGAAASVLEDQIHALRAIQSLDLSSPLRLRLERALDDMYGSALRAVKLKSIASPIAEFTGALALCITVGACVFRFTSGEIESDKSLSFIACLLLMYRPVRQIGELPGLWAPGRAALNRVLDLGLQSLSQDGRELGNSSSGLELHDVGIMRGERWIVRGVSVEVFPGEFLCITGANGSGKSTLIESMVGLRGVDEGILWLGGVPSSDVQLSDWRSQVGWLSQDSMLISGTVTENIQMGRNEYGRDFILAAWRRLGFEMPSDFDGFLDKPLLSEGAGLSGGEKRRILLTRACLADPAVLILDEPDAFLDIESRQVITRLAGTLKGERILIVVTHDAQLLSMADKVLRLGR